MDDETDKINVPEKDGIIAGSSALTGLAALIGASCCVLPIILVNLGVSTALVAKLAFFARAQNYFMALTAILIVGGFIAAYWKGRRPRKAVLVLLIIAAILTASSYVLPFYEGQLVRWISAR